MLNCFNDEIPINNLTTLKELYNVMELSSFGADAEERLGIIEQLRAAFGSDSLNISIKKVLFNIDTAKFSTNPSDELVQLMIESNLHP